MKYNNMYIIGAGAYGTALAQVFSKNININIISRNLDVVNSVNECNVNSQYFPDIMLRKNIRCTQDYENCKNADLICIVTPVASIRCVCSELAKHEINEQIPIMLCSKGLELNTLYFPTEIVSNSGLKNELFVLFGPSFAHEIIRDMKAGVSLSGTNKHMLHELEKCLSTDTFEISCNTDVIGTQICGAMKNVLAILCGKIIGIGGGQSTLALTITNALREISDLIECAGGNKETAYELCGIGDIILTCTNENSRNVKFGMFLASGGSLESWTGELAEGTFTAKAIPTLEEKFCAMPLMHSVYKDIYH